MSSQLIRGPAIGSLQLARTQLATTRTFSTTIKAETDKPFDNSSRNDRGPPRDRDSRRNQVMGVLENTFNSSPSSSSGQIRPRPATRGLSQNSDNRPSSRGVDARTLRANVPSGSQGPGSRSATPISERIQRFKEQLKSQGTGRPTYRGQGSRGGFSRGGPSGRRGPGANRKPRGDPRKKRDDDISQSKNQMDESELAYAQELQDKTRQKPARYNPKAYTLEMLKETWPSLPLAGNTTNVLEKLSWMGDRYVGSYEPIQVLAKRVHEGKRVLFSSTAEKDEAMELAKEMAVERAQKLSERKGEAIKPENVEFESIKGDERKLVIDQLVRGNYQQEPNPTLLGKAPVIASVLQNLNNNSTYHTAQTSQFMDKLVKGLPAAKRKAASKSA